MTHEDWMQVLGIVVTVLVGAVSAVIRVLFKHSNRLTDSEANIRAMREITTEDRRRQEIALLDIRERTIRIEDKLDRKADKP